MTEFVDLMLDGVVCQCCGQVLGYSTGYPRSCHECVELEIKKHNERSETNPDANPSASETDELDDALPF